MEISNPETITSKSKAAYSVAELSQEYSLSEAFLRNEIRAGRLKAKLVGRRVLILASNAEAYFNSQKDWEPGVFQGGRATAIAA